MYRMSFRDFVPDTWEDRAYVKHGGLRPAWAVINDRTYGGKVERQKAILDWQNRALEQLLQWREPLIRVWRTNRLIYIGQHYISQDIFEQLPYNQRVKYSKNNAKIVVNYIQYMTDQHVSDMSSYEPNITCSPMQDEEIDRVAARGNKDVIDYYFYEKKVKLRFQKFHRAYKVEGETFWFITWDEELGDYNPAYKKLREIRLQKEEDKTSNWALPVIDPETGAAVTGDDGEQLYIDRPLRVGDVRMRQMLAEKVVYPYPRSSDFDDVPFCWTLDWIPVDEAKARWPQVAEELKGDTMYSRYFPETGRSLHEEVCIRTLYHKPDARLENGYYSISTETALCEEGRYPYDHPYLPCIRGTDIEAPGEIHGISFIQNLASLQHALNNSTSMVLQNQSLFAWPKYAAPRGAKVRFRELDDDRGIYEYSGPKPPELITQNSTPQDTWKWGEMLRDHMRTLSGIYATSEGRAPDGITANVALRMIDEQERKFRKPMIDKHSESVQRMAEIILSVLGTYRDPSDGMLIKVVGKNNERFLRYFDVMNLTRPTEVKLMRSSGLPDSPAAKTQTVLDLSQQFSSLFSPDEVLEMLDIQRPEKLVESGTVARQAAESEVEDLLQGQPVTPPTEYYDILPRYRVYVKAMQGRAFEVVEENIKQRYISHVMTAEYLIARKMKLNPAFSQSVLQQFPNFPMFFPIQPTPMAPLMGPPPPVPMQMLPGGAPPLGGIPPEAAGPGAAMPPEAMPPGAQQNIEAPPPPPAQDIPPQPGGNLP